MSGSGRHLRASLNRSCSANLQTLRMRARQLEHENTKEQMISLLRQNFQGLAQLIVPVYLPCARQWEYSENKSMFPTLTKLTHESKGKSKSKCLFIRPFMTKKVPIGARHKKQVFERKKQIKRSPTFHFKGYTSNWKKPIGRYSKSIRC